MMHINSQIKEKALLLVYNPLDKDVNKVLTVPLYYTGLTEKAAVREKDGSSKTFKLGRDYTVRLPVTVPAQ